MGLFIFTSASAPVSGVFFGAWLGDRDGVNEYRSLEEVTRGLVSHHLLHQHNVHL